MDHDLLENVMGRVWRPGAPKEEAECEMFGWVPKQPSASALSSPLLEKR